MSRTIDLKQTTRIEGNAQIKIFLDDEDKVVRAHFQVMDFRGFEKFLQGCDLIGAPYIGARICGICSAAHELTAVEAIEEALGIEPNQTILNLREITLMGLMIKSHSLNLAFMVLPDLLGGPGEDIFDTIKKRPELGKTAFRVRNSGEMIENAVGGRNIHSSGLVVGGVMRSMGQKTSSVKKIARDVLSRIETFHTIIMDAMEEDLLKFPRSDASCISFLSEKDPHYLIGKEMTVRDPNGDVTHRFATSDYRDNIGEKYMSWTFSKFPYLMNEGWPDGKMTAGPLPRLTGGGFVDTPQAKEMIKELDRLSSNSPGNPFLNDLARSVEITLAAERVLDLLDDETTLGDEVRMPLPKAHGASQGTGAIEAPRGTLFHSYEIEDWRVKSAHILVPTQMNNAVINDTIEEIAKDHIADGDLTQEGRRLIGMCIRAMDPCLSCASHHLGEREYIEIIRVNEDVGTDRL